MKVRKLLVMVTALTLLFGTAAFAESVTQNIRIELNKDEIKDGGLLVDNKAYVGVGALSKAMQAIVSWDNGAKRASIYKPNVHMFTMLGDKPFGSITKGHTAKFNVFAQIDSLKTDISAFKVTITDPYGEETLIDGRNSSDKDFPTRGDFWFKTKDISYDFKAAGPYTIRFYMALSSGDTSLQVVSEKSIASVTGS